MELLNTQGGKAGDLGPDGILRQPKEFWIQDSDSGEGIKCFSEPLSSQKLYSQGLL